MPPSIGIHQLHSSISWPNNSRLERKSCNSTAVKLLRRLFTDATLKEIAIIFYLKQIFIKTLSGLPLLLRIKKSLRIKKPLPPKFNKISSIKPKGKTTFTSLKGFHESKDGVRRCEIKSIAGLLPYITLAIPSKH